MKKLGNKFILIVILIITLIVCFQVYIAYSNSNVDTNSYLTLVKGNGTLNQLRLNIEEEYILVPGDKIRVIGDSSLAVIQWGDGSLTRLGGNTKISIEQNEISRDYTNINISFDLIAGQTWSNVVSFIGKDSSFTQTFDGIEAGVRGTVFNVDLEKEFIYVTNHLIELKDEEGNTFLLEEGKALSLNNFSIIDITDFIASLEDVAWSQLNKQFDTEYFGKLTVDLNNSLTQNNPFLFFLEWISPKYKILYELDTSTDFSTIEQQIKKLNPKKRQGVYKEVLSKYQNINFVQSHDYESYKRKLFYKKALILLSDNDIDTQRLLQSTVYDLEDIIESKSVEGIQETLLLLSENKAILPTLNLSFLSGSLDYIPEGLLEEFKTNFGDIGNILNIKSLQNIDINTVGDVLDGADGAIQDFLDKNVGGLLDSIKQ